MGKLWDNAIDREALDQHKENAKRFFTAVAGDDIRQGSIVMIDESRERVAGMPVVMEMPYGPKRAKMLRSKKQFRRAFGVPCVVHDSVYFPDENRIAHYVGIEGKRYPIFDVRGYGGHIDMEAPMWPNVGTVGHRDWGPHRAPDVRDLVWRDSYPTDLAQLIKLFAQGIKA